MTESDIEIRVERMTDRLDARFMSGTITQQEYDREIVAIDTWASQQYRHIQPAPFREDFRNYR